MSDVTVGDFLDEAESGKRGTLGRIAALLERNGIAVEDIGRVSRVNAWQGFYKDPEGEAQTVDMVGVTLSPAWAEGPAWPVVQPAAPCKVSYRGPGPREADGWRVAVVLPDIQFGYYRDRDENLQPIHDEAALSVALQVARQARPSVVVLVGDNLDLAEMSRFRLSPAFARTMQATVDRVGKFLAELRATVGPDCRIVWLAGNHEERLPNYVLDNAKAAFGLRQANAPAAWPVLSVPFLCRTDDYDVEFVPGYPAADYWVNNRLRVIHGYKVSKNTTTAYLNDERVSTVYGHIHRREWAERTRSAHDGHRTILAASPGCLCRIDGRVPSVKGGIDHDGQPVSATEDWQQGLAVIEFQDGDGLFTYEQVAIHAGWARWRGKDYAGA